MSSVADRGSRAQRTPPPRGAFSFGVGVHIAWLGPVATVIPINGLSPQLPRFLAPNATLVGDVRFGPDCSVWFGAVLRGDIGSIRIGARTNIQDLVCVHLTSSTFGTSGPQAAGSKR